MPYFFILWRYVMRKFEKISKDNFFNSVPNGNYEDIILPKRSTKNSAGYDFYSLYDITIKPNERVVIPTGIKVCMNENEFLGIFLVINNNNFNSISFNEFCKTSQDISIPKNSYNYVFDNTKYFIEDNE